MIRRGLLFLSSSASARKVLTGTPLTRSVSRRFVPGEELPDLLEATRGANAAGLRVTGNYLGEAVRSEEDAERAADRYVELVRSIAAEGLDANASLKFTQMGQDISEPFLARNLGRVLEAAAEGGIFLRFDMESSAYTKRTLDAFEKLWAEGHREIGVVLQAYLLRTPGDVRRMVELGARVRLCKGAYAEPAEVAFQGVEPVRKAFLESMRVLLSEGHYPAIATHDDLLVEGTREFAAMEGIAKSDFEFQMLYGVRRDLQEALVADGYNVRVYIPYGEQWYPYLMRRLAERPENVAFMVGSVVKESPLGFLWPEGGRRDR
jgi:proline dehydrogenase